MSLLIQSGVRALKSLPNGKLLLILLSSMMLNAVILIAIMGGFFWLFDSLTFFNGWDWLVNIGFGFFAAAFGYFLFPIFLPLIVSFFDTAIADAIGETEYPAVKAKEPPFWPTLRHDIRFTLKALLLNLLSLPLYFIPGINFVIYYLLNGYLLGTEFFNIVAGRYITPEQGKILRERHRGQIILGGIAIAFSATVPILNLITPIWGVALMVHYFHAVNKEK